MIQNSTPQR